MITEIFQLNLLPIRNSYLLIGSTLVHLRGLGRLGTIEFSVSRDKSTTLYEIHKCAESEVWPILLGYIPDLADQLKSCTIFTAAMLSRFKLLHTESAGYVAAVQAQMQTELTEIYTVILSKLGALDQTKTPVLFRRNVSKNMCSAITVNRKIEVLSMPNVNSIKVLAIPSPFESKTYDLRVNLDTRAGQSYEAQCLVREALSELTDRGYSFNNVLSGTAIDI